MKWNQNLTMALIGCLTLGLAPFTPEPHIVGKIRWIMGGGHGMATADYLDLLMHGAPWLLFIFLLLKQLGSKSSNVDISEILKAEDVHIIDVREPRELSSGKINGSVNYPLSSFKKNIEAIKKLKGPKVLHCKSGMRSGRAVSMLRSAGVEDAYNGGGLSKMHQYLS